MANQPARITHAPDLPSSSHRGGTAALVAAGVAVFSFYLVLTGWLRARHRSGVPGRADWIAALSMLVAAVAMVAWGVSAIAAFTAFTVVNVRFEPAFVVWLAPTVVLTPVIVVWTARVNRGKIAD